MNFFEELTPEERNCIEQLKDRTIQDVTPKMMEDPLLFYRFSKARDFNLQNAEAMLRKHIAWRKKYDIDTVLTDYEPPEVLCKYIPINHLGFDNEGVPVQYCDFGGADGPGILKSAKKTDFIKFMSQTIEKDRERILNQSKKLAKTLTTAVYIYNFSGLTLSKATHKEGVENIINWLAMYQDNYPEYIKTVYVINASIYFSIFYSLCKYVVAANVIKKVRIFGTDGWKEVFRQNINPEILPAFLGGDKTDPDGDPLCKNFVIHGEIIPEHYYLQKSKRTLFQEPGVKKINISRFSDFKVTFDVKEQGTIIEWEFENKTKDVGFGIYFKDNDSKLIEVIPKERLKTSIEPETGIYKCDKVGLYVIIFDNSYSWLYSKEIYYKINMIPPDSSILNDKI